MSENKKLNEGTIKKGWFEPKTKNPKTASSTRTKTTKSKGANK